MNGSDARVAHVSEVLERLLAEFGDEVSQRPVLFQAALRACADESRRVKQGQSPASLDVLVERARAMLGSPQGKARLEAARGSGAVGVLGLSVGAPAPAGPPVNRTPSSAPVVSAPVNAPIDNPPRDARPPVGRPPVEAVPVDMPPAGASAVALAPPDRAPVEAAPRDVAAREPSAVEQFLADRAALLARPVPALTEEPTQLPAPGDAQGEPVVVTDSSDPDIEQAPAARRSRRPLVLALLALGVVVVAYAGVRLFGLPGPRRTASGSPAATQASRGPARANAGTPSTSGTTSPAAPAAVATPPASAAALAAAAAPTPRPPAGWAETMATPDWIGKAPIYAVHFSSYRERDRAERDAADIAKRYDRPTYAAQVSLPERGDYFRVILGDFDTAAAARAFRADLLAAGTPGVGGVYWVVPLH